MFNHLIIHQKSTEIVMPVTVVFDWSFQTILNLIFICAKMSLDRIFRCERNFLICLPAARGSDGIGPDVAVSGIDSGRLPIFKPWRRVRMRGCDF